jgi:NAD+ diphosphatase
MVWQAAVAAPAVTRGRQFILADQALYVVRGEAVTVPEGPIAGSIEGDWIYLGAQDGQSCFARLASPGEVVPGAEPVAMRALFGALGDADFAIAGRALGLTAWDRDHRWCGRCGGETARSSTERVRTCRRCGFAAYPRLSPAVIMLVERDGRALLARNGANQMRFHSVLAGFVEVGESLEEAVHREVAEEVGVRITDVRYFGSQPWPLTNSLMVGFTAQWASGELSPDGTEIAEAAWYAPDRLPLVPGPISISRGLIDDWVRRRS